MTYRLRDFLKIFPTTFEYAPRDTGFFSDPVKERLTFIREGRVISWLDFSKMQDDPELAYELWRRKFAGSAPWKTDRGTDK